MEYKCNYAAIATAVVCCICQLQQSTQREANLEANIRKFLNPDQIEKIKQPHDHKGRNVVWSSETIQRCLTIRSVVGRNGYDYLRKMNYPLPSYRTLCRRIQTLSFTPGIQYDVLEWLKVKTSAKESQKLCVLLVDEMQLQSRIEFDKGLRRIVGYVSPETLPTDAASGADKEPATHALVFMLRGLMESWKQTVAYLFTGASLKREPFWKFTQEVIKASESAGLQIQGVTTDMGPANTGLWNHVGIESTRSSVIPAVTHPCNSSDRLLYFVADPPHLLKNLWNCLLVHQVNLSAQTVQRYNLPSDVVKGFVYVSQLLDAQNCHELRMAYKLKSCHVTPTQYDKMRVCLAAQFCSRSTAAAIQTCVNLDVLPVEALTTAWFLNFVNDWFDAMNARHKEGAQFRGKVTAGTHILEEMLQIIKDLAFDGKKTWKPVQAGIQLSTTAALQLSQQVMSAHNMQYFLTGRLSQDPVENLFSQARGQGVMHPSCSSFRQALRLVTIAQYLHVSKNAAYEEDGCAYLIDYLSQNGVEVDDESLLPALLSPSVALESVEECEVHFEYVEEDGIDELLEVGQLESMQQNEAAGIAANEEDTVGTETRSPLKSVENVPPPTPLDQLECNALYDIMGCILSKVFRKVDCDACHSAFIAANVSNDCSGQYTVARSYGGLLHPSQELLAAAQLAEQILGHSIPVLQQKVDIDLHLVKEVEDVLDSCKFHFPACHNVLHNIVKKYTRLRINQYASAITSATTSRKKRQYGSKTACRITMVP